MSVRISYFRNCGITIGENCFLYSFICTPEPYLITIGDNVTISTDVRLLTHDNSISKTNLDGTDLFGKIIIGNNCFIGARAIILPGITLGDNCIVAAGSVVTKTVEANCIVAGNPAKVISTVEVYKNKNTPYVFDMNGLNKHQKRELLLSSLEKLLSR